MPVTTAGRAPRALPRAGFTLIELLVAVSLMVVLTIACAVIFSHAGTIFLTGEAQVEVYQNARAAFDIMGRDLNGIIPLSLTPDPTTGYPDVDYKCTLYDPRDEVNNKVVIPDTPANQDGFLIAVFYTTARVDGAPIVTWVRYSMKLDPDDAGTDPMDNTLRREVDVDKDGKFDQTVDAREAPEDLCQYVKTVRIEYLDHTLSPPDMVDMDLTTYERRFDEATSQFSDATIKGLPKMVRITMVVLDAHDRQERTITRVFEIPSS